MSRRIFGAALASFALLAPAASPAAELRDVLDTPAAASAFARMGLLNGLARAGKRVVAVGQRGHVLYSDDAGRTWLQAKVPVSSDLVAVTFPTPSHGWAVGHDGVVLHSADAGATWIRQLDGRSAGQAMVAYYAAEAAKGGSGDAAKLLDEAKRFAEQGAENPFLDVWFEDERTGFVVGAFNLILRTADGGKTWEPWLHRTDNPKTLHLYCDPTGGWRAVHRRRAGTAAQARRAERPVPRARAAVPGHAVRDHRQREERRGVRPQGQRVPQRRRRQDVAEDRDRPPGRPHRRRDGCGPPGARQPGGPRPRQRRRRRELQPAQARAAGAGGGSHRRRTRT